MTAELILELRPLMFYTALAMIITVIAMTVDLIAGWRKATIRGDAHTSYAFSRTITKFLMYEGGYKGAVKSPKPPYDMP